jgi:hypothetical protein
MEKTKCDEHKLNLLAYRDAAIARVSPRVLSHLYRGLSRRIGDDAHHRQNVKNNEALEHEADMARLLDVIHQHLLDHAAEYKGVLCTEYQHKAELRRRDLIRQADLLLRRSATIAGVSMPLSQQEKEDREEGIVVLLLDEQVYQEEPYKPVSDVNTEGQIPKPWWVKWFEGLASMSGIYSGVIYVPDERDESDV